MDISIAKCGNLLLQTVFPNYFTYIYEYMFRDNFVNAEGFCLAIVDMIWDAVRWNDEY